MRVIAQSWGNQWKRNGNMNWEAEIVMYLEGLGQ